MKACKHIWRLRVVASLIEALFITSFFYGLMTSSEGFIKLGFVFGLVFFLVVIVPSFMERDCICMYKESEIIVIKKNVYYVDRR